MKPEEFLDMLVGPARACHRETGIPASFTLAQAALESAWGSSKLTKSGCNLFGVKADKSWKGPVTMMLTREVIRGKSIMVDAKWRCYKDWNECLADRAQFFRKNPRYAKCFLESTGGGWARAVANAGYATDPDYAKKLIAIIYGRNLTRFDVPNREAA